MANFLNGFLDGLLGGTTNPKGNLGDYAHAARLYTDDALRLAPKTKYLYHVVFELGDGVTKMLPQLDARHKNEINMLVKSVDLPKYTIATETKNMYNRKKNVQTGIDYDPININFHDDNLGITSTLMEAYYRYYYQDGNHATDGVSGAYNPRNTYKGGEYVKYRYGFDNDSSVPFFRKITIYQMARKEYISYTLVNPLVTTFSHDSLDQGDATGLMANQITVAYESVFYGRGATSDGSIPGFAQEHYDNTPSPLGLQGGGTQSLFGIGGVSSGISGVLGDLANGEASLGTLLTAANTYKNAKKLTKEGLREEGLNILGNVLGNIGNNANVSGVPNSTFPKSNGNGGAGNTTPSTGGSVNTSAPGYAAKVAQAQQNNR